MDNKDKIDGVLSKFKCQKDNEVEDFLVNKAVKFEKLGKSRTFLIFDESEVNLELKILGYYSLALQVFQIPESLSNTKIKKLDGLSAKIKGEAITQLPTLLIGQLGKNSLYEIDFDGGLLMEYCLSTILNGQAYLGGRLVLIETKGDIDPLTKFYESFDFHKLEENYTEGELVQFIRVLQEDEIME